MALFRRKKQEIPKYPADTSFHPQPEREVTFDEVLAFMVDLEDLDARKMMNAVNIMRQARSQVDKIMAVTQEDIDKAKAEAERIETEARKAEADKTHAKAMTADPKFIDNGPGKQRKPKTREKSSK